MDKQIILVCDDQGRFSGEYIPKEVGHLGDGKRHLAITVLLSNSKEQVLLQKRKHKVFNSIWDFTGATHHLHKADGSDETDQQATLRCLEREYGIKDVQVKKIGEFNYFAKDGKNCENEHCMMMIGEYNGELNLNPEAGYEYKWMGKKEFLEDIKKNPQKYSAWANEGVRLLKKAGFFNN